ncbi:beta-lactamase-like protein [Gorgonomyces haynaldii]|nr:beta-lactamase-like protein [Gorgonomyces haynaldii]
METTGTASVDEKKWKRPPDFKWVKYTSFTVDAFRYGPINGCTAYFLSHFHSDHYMGLTSKFQHGPIYCSQITADLVMQQLRVPKEWIYPLPLEENITIQGVQVRLIDANHCPGAVLFYFEAPDPPTRILHTGDFRACEAHWTHPNLQGRIDFLYLDTTYCKPIYKFPPQEQTSMMDKFLKTKPKSNILVVVGSYSIGKEKVFLRASQVLNSKIYCKANKLRLLKCLQLPDLDHRLTKNPKEANVHVVSMNTLAKDDLIEYFETFKNDFDSMIAVKPTGWTFKPNQVPDLKHLSPSFVSQRIVLVPLAYSEHSSFAELETFAKEMHFTKIFSTVPSRYSLDPILDKWVK